MFNDIKGVVIDTNVFVHAANEEIYYCEHSKLLLQQVLESDILLYVDDVYDIVESKNTSRINSEYVKHVRTGTLAFAFLLQMATKDRIAQIEEPIYNKHKKEFKKMVMNKDDIIFLSVTMCTPDKLLVSNDFEDLTIDKRKYWRKNLSLNIYDSKEASEV